LGAKQPFHPCVISSMAESTAEKRLNA
jgi:hypothetical protein